MAFIDIQLLIQCLLYLVIFVCGFVISIPIGINSMNFQGMCILFADFTLSHSGKYQFVMTSSNRGNCNFPIILGVFGCIFYGLGLGCYYAYAIRRSRTDTSVGSKMLVMPYMLVNAAISVTLLVASSLVSIGFKKFCDDIKEYGHVDNCRVAEHKMWTNVNNGEKFSTGYFYSLLTIAQIACWTAFLLYLLQIALGLLRFWRNKRLRFTPSDKERIAEAV